MKQFFNENLLINTQNSDDHEQFLIKKDEETLDSSHSRFFSKKSSSDSLRLANFKGRLNKKLPTETWKNPEISIFGSEDLEKNEKPQFYSAKLREQHPFSN